MKIVPLYNERAVLERLAASDKKAFAELFEHHYNGLTSFIITMLKSEQLSQDVAQEVFMKIWEQRTTMTDIQSFSNYLFIMARNRSMNVLRKVANENAAKGFIVNHIPHTVNNVSEKLVLEGYWEFIESVLKTLPTQTREVFKLCRLEHKTHDEIAELLGITRDAVKRHMMKSNKVFKDSVDKELGMKLTLLYWLFSGGI